MFRGFEVSSRKSKNEDETENWSFPSDYERFSCINKPKRRLGRRRINEIGSSNSAGDRNELSMGYNTSNTKSHSQTHPLNNYVKQSSFEIPDSSYVNCSNDSIRLNSTDGSAELNNFDYKNSLPKTPGKDILEPLREIANILPYKRVDGKAPLIGKMPSLFNNVNSNKEITMDGTAELSVDFKSNYSKTPGKGIMEPLQEIVNNLPCKHIEGKSPLEGKIPGLYNENNNKRITTVLNKSFEIEVDSSAKSVLSQCFSSDNPQTSIDSSENTNNDSSFMTAYDINSEKNLSRHESIFLKTPGKGFGIFNLFESPLDPLAAVLTDDETESVKKTPSAINCNKSFKTSFKFNAKCDYTPSLKRNHQLHSIEFITTPQGNGSNVNSVKSTSKSSCTYIDLKSSDHKTDDLDGKIESLNHGNIPLKQEIKSSSSEWKNDQYSPLNLDVMGCTKINADFRLSLDEAPSDNKTEFSCSRELSNAARQNDKCLNVMELSGVISLENDGKTVKLETRNLTNHTDFVEDISKVEPEITIIKNSESKVEDVNSHKSLLEPVAKSPINSRNFIKPSKNDIGQTEECPSKQLLFGVQKDITRPLSNIVYVNNKSYTVLSMLGRGGSSEVYQVLETSNLKLMALKIVNLSAVEESIAKGYLNEIMVLLKLQGCPTVIRMFDHEYNKETKMLYVLMEKGDTDFSRLMKDIMKTKKISISMITYYWTEIVNAVKDIHEKGIIHSDLKPANFLLVSGRLKLIDFGIASSLQGDMTSVLKDVTTGTFNYMSPEAIRNSGETKGYKITYKSDIWSLGCILYNLLYGKTPFSHLTNTWTKLQAIADPEHSVSFPADSNISPQLHLSVRWALTKDPKDRPTANELLKLAELNPGSETQLGRQISCLLGEFITQIFPNCKAKFELPKKPKEAGSFK